jgi:hypothetical protein
MSSKIFKPNREDEKCAPSKKYDETVGTCFSLEQLQKMAESYNKINSDKITITDNKKNMLRQLIRKLDATCSSQVCLLEKQFVRDIDDFDLIHNTYRPLGTVKRYQWLSTSDINKVMIQYMELYKDFVFFGALPSDFQKIQVPVPYNNFFQLLTNMFNDRKYRLGYIFNADKHNESGSHWMGLFANLKKNQVYFFDSAEDHSKRKPMKEITDFMKTIAVWCYQNNVAKGSSPSDLCSLPFFKTDKNIVEQHVDVRFNRVQHQKANTECGVYSLNFIIRLLQGDSFDTIVNRPINDATMNEFRKEIFRFM